MNRIGRSNQPLRQGLKRLAWLGLGTTLGQLVSLLMGAVGQPTLAAERIIISYGPLQRSIRVSQLERFVETGQLDQQLSEYASLFNLTPEQLEQLRQALNTSANLDVVAVGQFLYTPQGKFLLKQVSQVVQTPSGQAGFLATRGALILAAADQDGGLTILNFLRHFPTDGIRIDVAQGLAIASALNFTLSQSSQAIQTIQAESATIAAQTPQETLVTLAQTAAAMEQQAYDVRVFDLNVPGLPAPADLYLPEPKPGSGASPFNRPVIVISHGLGSDRTSFSYLAEVLTSGGFAVVAVEHPGSNTQQLTALLDGRTGFVTPTEEFIDRPLEVRYILDVLQQEVRRNPLYRNRLDLSRVGVIGQSFGGYTALALAGAPLDLNNLGRQCLPTAVNLNLSLLLQCQATLLSNPGASLIDPRIRAVFVMNPVGSAIFGPRGYAQIDAPVMVVASTADTVAPAFFEQITPFDWLTAPDRYLVLIGNATHFSVIGEGQGTAIPVPEAIMGPRPDLAQDYMKTLSLAFFKAYLQGDERFRVLLQPAFVENFMSEDPLPLSLIEGGLPAAASQGSPPLAATSTAPLAPPPLMAPPPPLAAPPPPLRPSTPSTSLR